MIAQSSFRLDHIEGQQPPVHFASFGEAELAEVMPLDTENLYFSDASVGVYSRDSAAELAVKEDEGEHTLTWGIYQGEVSPETFLGTASLTEVLHGDPAEGQYTRIIQETGTYIMRPSVQSKGIGSLAKLAVMSHALETHGTKAFQAYTSEHNLASQKSLAKVGFSHLDTVQYIDFPGGEASQYWAVAHPDAQRALASTDTETDALVAGWQRYQEKMQHLKLAEL